MEIVELLRVVLETAGIFALIFLAGKYFRFKGIIVKLISASEDTKITESQFQDIIHTIKVELWPKKVW
jgi:hypothetical protein